MELPKVYNPEETEERWYAFWLKNSYFLPSSDKNHPSFSLVIPPPNVTGSLHMGHALNATLQDVLARWRRMQGYRALWVPGTDHGGIATQNVVEKLLKTEGKSRHDLGREAFLERMWQWRTESGDTILLQLKRLGASLEWGRTRFTMDEACSKAVRLAFVELFNKGLIYRGYRMVNWCPRCRTALSDIEVEHEERRGKLWHLRYPLQNPQAGEPTHIIVATTRPETMLGDTAIAVNPEDERYKSLVGRRVVLPIVGREIPIVADAVVDATFGTGAVKVTPAHDQTDFEIGERQHLPHVVVIDFEGKMTKEAGVYAGLDRMECRKRLVQDLEQSGLLEKVEDYKLSVALCYRCQTIVEPLMSDQWFLRMGDMAARAATASREGKVAFYPASWEKPYLLWLDNLRDWCISRQIWWGHRIPVYYCPNNPTRTGENKPEKPCPAFAASEPPTACPQCQSTDLRQDEDVLDTWFSSALWPLSTLGWPEETDDLKSFYPTSVLATGHEILYLWVARMVMFGLYFRGEVPFRHVFIHGIVRDKTGKKMSKSLGNVINPLDIMKEFGTDALRLTLASSSVPGRDMQLSNDAFLKSRNFANKLWNASRFLFMNLEGYQASALASPETLNEADQWILHELNNTIDKVTAALGEYDLAETGRLLYTFVWASFCDWYLELAKIRLTGDDVAARRQAQSVLVHVLEKVLLLLHPIMPFETEEIYQALRSFIPTSGESIMIQPWPSRQAAYDNPVAFEGIQKLQNLVTAIRTVRSEMSVPPGQKLPKCIIRVAGTPWISLLQSEKRKAAISALTRVELSGLEISSDAQRPAQSAVGIFDGGEVFLPLEGIVDFAKEKARLQKDATQVESQRTRDEATLANPDFIARAPQEEVERVRQRIEETRSKLAWIRKNMEGF